MSAPKLEDRKEIQRRIARDRKDLRVSLAILVLGIAFVTTSSALIFLAEPNPGATLRSQTVPAVSEVRQVGSFLAFIGAAFVVANWILLRKASRRVLLRGQPY